MDRIVEMSGDGLAPTRVTGKENIPPHVTLHTVDMELLTDTLHIFLLSHQNRLT
jgi:hypothetical protein